MKFNLQEAFDWLLATEEELAKHKAAVYVWERGEKITKANLAKICMEPSQAAKENYALAHPDYLKYVQDTANAIENYETLKLQRETKFAMFEAWRSINASERNMINKTR